MAESEAAYAGVETATGSGTGTEPSSAGSETFGITCPECGGSLRIHEGEKSIKCAYCGCALCVSKPKGVRGYYLPPRITAGKAKLEALRYLSESTGGRIRARHASILDVQLINVPFWRMNGRLVGWVCGEKITTRQVEVTVQGPNGPTTTFKTVEEHSPYNKLIFKRIDWSTPACSLRHLGLQGISLRARFLDWDIFDHDLKNTMNIALPLKSRKEAEKDGFNYLTGLATPRSSTVKAKRFRMFDNDFSLYYYPIYIMRYRHRDVIYSITVDGNDGRVIRGDYPRRVLIDLKTMFSVPAAAAILAGTWLPLLPIAAGILYIADMVRGGTIVLPHRWFFGRLEGWFGGEL
ncbi:MAG TPA: hypothetical protein VLA34_01665 [Candidatus Krumholzibacterium sp.]|nr:hypothetical protein [Candidatus Krumholzibacterium sp.]